MTPKKPNTVEKKVMHKVKKQWVVYATAFTAVAGIGLAANQANVHADTTDSAQSTLDQATSDSSASSSSPSSTNSDTNYLANLNTSDATGSSTTASSDDSTNLLSSTSNSSSTASTATVTVNSSASNSSSSSNSSTANSNTTLTDSATGHIHNNVIYQASETNRSYKEYNDANQARLLTQAKSQSLAAMLQNNANAAAVSSQAAVANHDADVMNQLANQIGTQTQAARSGYDISTKISSAANQTRAQLIAALNNLASATAANNNDSVSDYRSEISDYSSQLASLASVTDSQRAITASYMASIDSLMSQMQTYSTDFSQNENNINQTLHTSAYSQRYGNAIVNFDNQLNSLANTSNANSRILFSDNSLLNGSDTSLDTGDGTSTNGTNKKSSKSNQTATKNSGTQSTKKAGAATSPQTNHANVAASSAAGQQTSTPAGNTQSTQTAAPAQSTTGTTTGTTTPVATTTTQSTQTQSNKPANETPKGSLPQTGDNPLDIEIAAANGVMDLILAGYLINKKRRNNQIASKVLN